MNKINTIIALATTEEIRQGMLWYRDAHKFVSSVSCPLRSAAALAALSPRNKWERNKQDLISVYRQGATATVATFNANKEKALRVLDLETPVHEIRNILNGRKVVSFYNNVLHPTSDTTVTVDVWMYRLFNLPPNNVSYDAIERSIRTHARSIGLLPHELQAILWVIGRRLHASDYDFHKGLFASKFLRNKAGNEAIITV